MSLLKNILLYGIIFLLLNACANQSSPQGGPKDTSAPRTKIIYPVPGSTNFRDKRIILTFNEDVSADNIQERLLITPFIEIPYKTVIRRGNVELIFDKKLPENLTYTFNFRDAIKDITEKNVANVTLSFSTGPFLDSQFVSGNVKDLFTDKNLENVMVALYPSADTFPAAKAKPMYLTQTTKEGTFRIQNIKDSIYDLYVIADNNKNYLYNEDEKLGFVKNIRLKGSKDSLAPYLIKISKFDSNTPKVRTLRQNGDKIEMNLSEGIDTFNIQIQDSSISRKLYPVLSSKGNILTLYVTGDLTTIKDSIEAELFLQDSSGHAAKEHIKFIHKLDLKKSKEPVTFGYIPTDGKVNPKQQEINLLFNKPIAKINSDKIKVKSDTAINSIEKENIRLKNPLNATLNLSSKAKDSLFLLFENGAFESKDTISSKQQLKFNIKKDENYSLLEVSIRTAEPSFFIELLNERYELVARFANEKKHIFHYLNPGTYFLRATIDLNKNGKWDAGDIKIFKLPENMIFFKNKIEVRANWEVRDVVFDF